MITMTITFSRNLAIVIGIVTPVLETIRRWSTWTEYPPAMLDDYFIGGFLLYGAWRVSKNAVSGQRFLAAAWRVGLGMVFLSFFGQLRQMQLGEVDPAPVSTEWVAVIKGIGLLIVIVGLITSLRRVSIAD
jgi:hypothetical protein